MHWLPLVAMVIASALPFPHNPATSTVVATNQPGSDPAFPPVDYRGNASQTNNMAAAGQRDRHNLQKDYAETSDFDLENHVNLREETGAGSDVPAAGEELRTEDFSEDNFLEMELKPKSRSRQSHPEPVKTSKDSFSFGQNHNFITAGGTLEGQRGPEASEHLRDTPTIRTMDRTEERLTTEVGQTVRADTLLGGDELFLDAHPRILFSPSTSPPEHPPLLLMLESGLLEEDEEQEDMDGRIEGHGDRAIDRSTTPSWRDSKEAVHPVRRDKRSHLIDKRRGEKSVCESESVWVTDKEKAIDSHGREVTILKEIQTQTGPLKQYFYETRCRQAEAPSYGNRTKGAVAKPGATGVAGAGCLGVDKKQWLSECKAKQSFVRALTKDTENRIGWRWIRIDSSCVCVLLSRSNQSKAVMTKKGRG